MTRLGYQLLSLVLVVSSSCSYIKREDTQPHSSESLPALIHPVCRAATTWASPWDLHGFTPYNSYGRIDNEDVSPIDSVHAERRFEQGFQQMVGSSGFTIQKRAFDVAAAIDYTKREYLQDEVGSWYELTCDVKS
jgi:hypothetical protein